MSFHFTFDSNYEKDIDAGSQRFVDRIKYALDGSDYDNGELETIRDTANQTVEFVARLCLVLVEKKLISMEEIKKCLDPSIIGYNEKGNHKWPVDNSHKAGK